jgi:hypothetical protein
VLGCALLVALTGCRLMGGGGDESGPPPGGWPQPAGDRVTESMCGLLTNADYAKLGHVRRPKMTSSVVERFNSVDCQYESTDDMTLSLQPTAEFAKYLFAAELKDHKKQLAEVHRQSSLVSGVVGPADESWFDYWTLGTAEARPVAHELRVRRGALILDITLSGVRGEKEKDPRSVLVDLADLVLRRLPHVGAKDTGRQHKIQYGVIGAGRLKSVEWSDYTDVQDGDIAKNVLLPWLRTVPMASADGVQPDPLILRAEARSPRAKIGCLIVVDDEPVAAERPRPGSVECQAPFPDSGDGGDSAQPASSRWRPAHAVTGHPL